MFNFASLNKRLEKMYLTSEVKKEIFKKNSGSEKNTGSSETVFFT